MYKHIIVGIDFSEGSDRIVKKAKEIAEAVNAKITLLHVVEFVPEQSIGYLMSPEIVEKFVEESRGLLAGWGNQIQVSAENQLVELGSPKTVIADVAQRIGADLIVVGSHGRHGWTALLGSTASSLLHGVTCDLLTVRMDQL